MDLRCNVLSNLQVATELFEAVVVDGDFIIHHQPHRANSLDSSSDMSYDMEDFSSLELIAYEE